jgi:thiamine-monophosphate kinase
MSGEADFLRRLKRMATDPAARGLMDDAAVLCAGAHQLVFTSDTMIEGVHFRPDDPAETVGWKLAAVNLSDLAAKGATPTACLLNYALKGDHGWDMAFLDGLERALTQFGMPLIGGDTVSLPAGAPRMIGLTALGEAPSGQGVPSRAGARPGDRLYVSGPVGDAGAGLALLNAGREAPDALVSAYRLPQPHVALGQVLAPMARAMMDVSDGLLIDARRMAEASGCAVEIGHVPLSEAYEAERGGAVEARLAAATAGDDYVLLVALAGDCDVPGELIEVGRFLDGQGISILLDGEAVPVPDRLGYEHG